MNQPTFSSPHGLANAAFGAPLHYFNAIVVAGIYFVADQKIPALVRKPVLYGGTPCGRVNSLIDTKRRHIV